MPSVELPPGRYLSCAFGVAPDMGGQTRALLMRNRFLAREGGVRPDVLTLGPGADYQQRREILLERGLLDERLGLLNIFDHYREHGWGESRSGGAPLADLAAHRVGEQERPDGSPWRISYRFPGTSRLVHDYLRADGSPYLRIPDFGLSDKSSWKLTAQQVAPDGTVVGGFSSPGRWFRRWIRELAEGHERAFVFVDSRFVVRTSSRSAGAASTCCTRCTTCTCSRRGAGTRRCPRSMAACWRASAAWTRWST